MKARKFTFIAGTIAIILLGLVAVFGVGSIKGAAEMRFGIDISGGVEAMFEPKDLDRDPTYKELESAKTVIEKRLDDKNITDREVIISEGNGSITVRFPWKSDEKEFNPDKAIAELGETAQLTFRNSEGEILVDGTNVSKSIAEYKKDTGAPIVTLEFNAKGTADFAAATKTLVGKELAIYMDEESIFTANVDEAITGGEAIIEGLDSAEEAKDLASKINAGSLPFSMTTTNHSSISPSLGTKALGVMMKAGVLAFFIVCLFMIFYYRLPGFISCLTIIFQIASQMLFLSIPQFTLTLPGIAGLILSVGMAVDANIIISERISEELNKGKTIPMAIKEGYKNGFSAVFDGNVTAGIVALILMIFGSGTMLSFGYTLFIGMILNMLVVGISKSLLSSFCVLAKIKNVKFFRQKKERKIINFFKYRFVAFGISALLMVVGAIAIFTNGVSLDTQFAGGAMLKYTYVGGIETGKCEDIAFEALGRTATAQISENIATGDKRLVLALAGNEGITPQQQEKLFSGLEKAYPDAKLALSDSTIVAPYIGKAALQDSVIALLLASAFIVLYVWFRYASISGLSAAIMALVALLHDMIIVFFTFVVFKIPLNDAFVAVELTIIGYSINDTIVIYDRIRENKRIQKGISLENLVNQSVTQSMARSINTFVATEICVGLVLIFAVLFGIDSIRVFAIPLFFGLISGCYSTICIAGSLWVTWKHFLEKRKERKKAPAM